MIRQIDYKQAFILNENIGVSYNTPIAANVNGISFITENYYSNTTAHHKTDVLREFNNEVVIEINQDTIKTICNLLSYNKYEDLEILVSSIIEEEKTKNYLIKTLRNEDAIPNNIKVYAAIESIYQKDITFKTNCNVKNVQEYKTVFKHVSNFRFKITNHIFKKKIKYYANSSSGWNTRQEIVKINRKAVIYSY